MKKLCYVTNFASHYREDICIKIQQELDADVFFGSRTFAKIQPMSFERFNPKPVIFQTKIFANRITWIEGLISLLLNSDYKYYLFIGEPHNVSVWIALVLSKFFSKKIFLWSHGMYGREAKFSIFIKYLFYNLSSGIFVYGKLSKKLLIESGIPESKIYVIYNSLNSSKINLAKKHISRENIYATHFKNSSPVLLYIGRIEPQKKLELLINAIDICKKDYKQNMNLIIIGDGDHKTNLEIFARGSESYANIWFYGPCYNESKIGKLIYNADLCISPGEVGLTAIHSMIYGTPVITHNNFSYQGPEFEAIESGITGEFFVEDDPVSLANTISDWITKYPKKDSEIIENCMNRVKNYYNPDYQVELLKRVFK